MTKKLLVANPICKRLHAAINLCPLPCHQFLAPLAVFSLFLKEWKHQRITDGIGHDFDLFGKERAIYIVLW